MIPGFPFPRCLLRAGLAAAIALLAGGCTLPGLLVGAGATAGIAAAQERGLEGALDDTGIAFEVNRRLLAENEKLFLDVAIEVTERRVLLTGNVPQPENRIAAARLAWTAPGVREVINEIEVAEDDGLAGYAKDAAISTRLRLRMMGDAEISAINYTIETARGTVYLLGIAQSDAELARTVNHARDIAGVRNVVSHVRVKSQATGSIR